MATISERRTKDGKIRFQAKVRLKGHPPQTATFRTRRDAARWEGMNIVEDGGWSRCPSRRN